MSSTPLQARPGVPRKAFRTPDDSYLGGVCAGLADHLRVSPTWVRVFFVATGTAGFGVLLYLGLWITLPMADGPKVESPGLEAATRRGLRPRRTMTLRDAGPLVALAVVLLGLAGIADLALGGPQLFWPVFFAVGGVAVLWRQADQAQRERWLDTTGRLNLGQIVLGSGGVAAYARLATGLGLLFTALLIFAAQAGRLQAAQDVVIAAILGVLGLAVTLGPWLVRLVSDLSEEHAARVRSQERADVAAHLHDSVLQTLALIQKNPADSSQVARLARSQERELRDWMYGAEASPELSVASALKAAAAEVEDTHGVPIEVVTVGDTPPEEPISDNVRALVQATREAMVNAAKHAGVPVVDVYAEVSSDGLAVFVRDRGVGFDPEAVPTDRLGLRNSIIDRLARHGGRAEIRSEPGAGTEVRLHLSDIGANRQ